MYKEFFNVLLVIRRKERVYFCFKYFDKLSRFDFFVVCLFYLYVILFSFNYCENIIL